MIFALMLILSIGSFSIGEIVLTQPVLVGIHTPVIDTSNQFELAYTHHNAIWIQSNQEMNDQATAESWPGEGTAESPYIISGYLFDQDTQPIRIWNTDLFWILTGCLIESDGTDQQCGTWLDGVINGVITGNEFRYRHAGMYILNVENTNITENEIHDNLGYGMEFGGWIKECNVSYNTIYNCPNGGIRVPAGTFNSTIIGNAISDCGGLGITLMGSIQNSIISNNIVERISGQGIATAMMTNSIVSLNSITNTSDNGIAVFGSTRSQIINNTVSSVVTDEGITATYFDESLIKFNTIDDCDGIGIEAISGENSTIQWNVINGCSDYALELQVDTMNYEVNFNTFNGNGATCQICDHGDSNDISFNYYSEWTSPDADVNGIVDSPYAFDGDAENEDPYPLAVAGVVPEIETPTTTPEDPTTIPMTFIAIGAGAVILVLIVVGVATMKRK